MTLKQLTALRSMVVNRFNHWDEGMNSYFEEPMCKLLLELIDAEIERQSDEEPTVEEIAKVTGWMLRMREAFKRGDE